MAKNININSYKDTKNFPIVKPIKRLDTIPVDDSGFYETLADAQAYAQDESGVAYVGQILYIKSLDNEDERGLYYIKDEDGTLVKVGSGSSTGTADWNNNIEGSAGYIYNRTHYIKSQTKHTDIFANGSVSEIEVMQDVLTVGKIYKVNSYLEFDSVASVDSLTGLLKLYIDQGNFIWSENNVGSGGCNSYFKYMIVTDSDGVVYADSTVDASSSQVFTWEKQIIEGTSYHIVLYFIKEEDITCTEDSSYYILESENGNKVREVKSSSPSNQIYLSYGPNTAFLYVANEYYTEEIEKLNKKFLPDDIVYKGEIEDNYWTTDPNETDGTTLIAKLQGENNSIVGKYSTIFSSSDSTIGSEYSFIAGSTNANNIYATSDNSSIISSRNGIINGSKYTTILASNFGVVGTWATLGSGHGTKDPLNPTSYCNAIIASGLKEEPSVYDGGLSITGNFDVALGVLFKNDSNVFGDNVTSASIYGDASSIISTNINNTSSSNSQIYIEGNSSSIFASDIYGNARIYSSAKSSVIIGCTAELVSGGSHQFMGIYGRNNLLLGSYGSCNIHGNSTSILSSWGGTINGDTNYSTIIVGNNVVIPSDVSYVAAIGLSSSDIISVGDSGIANDNTVYVHNLYGFGDVDGSSSFILSDDDAEALFDSIFNQTASGSDPSDDMITA